MPATFISYRHEGQEFLSQVRDFAERLQGSGIDVRLDQLYSESHPGGPDEGWDRWSSTQVKRADRVLIVCSPGWFRSFEGLQLPGEALGATHEARLIYTEFYESGWRSAKHRLVTLAGTDPGDIPLDLRHVHRFDSDADFDQVVAWIAGPPATQRAGKQTAAGVRWPEPLTDFTPDFANRQDVWPTIERMLTGHSRKRIVILEGETNHGKSELIRECVRYAREAGLLVVAIDFKGGHRTISHILGELDLTLGPYLPEFSGSGARDPLLLRRDLRRLERPLLVLLDTYEQALSNREVADWVQYQLLIEVEHCPALAVLVAGQESPDRKRALWKDQSQHFRLGPITETKAWEDWVRRRFPRLESADIDINTLVLASEGVPGAMAVFCSGIASQIGKGDGR